MSNKKNKQKQKTPKGLVVFVLLLLAVCVCFFGYIWIEIISPTLKNEESGVVSTKTIKGKNDFKVEGELSVEYNGGKLFAGGQAIAEDFKLTVKNGDEVKVISREDYECAQLDPDFRLALGGNEFLFKYGDKTVSTSVTAVSVDAETTSPNYLLKKADAAMTEDLISQIDNGEITYNDVMGGWGFIGDSQIAALNLLYYLISDGSIMAEVGSGLDYIFDNYDYALYMLQSKSVVVIHTGINSLVAFPDSVDKYIEKYGELIDRLKADRPDLRIVISGLFPVSARIADSQRGYSMIEEVNFKLVKLCMEKGVEFISNYGDVLGQENYFAGDGLHMESHFYTDYWLKDLLRKLGS